MPIDRKHLSNPIGQWPFLHLVRLYSWTLICMTRGNQRELARVKTQKKNSSQKKERDVPEGMSVQNVKLQYTSSLSFEVT